MTVVRQTAAESAAATGRRRASFHPLTVDEVRRLTDDAIEVTFGVPAELAGQFDYLPGQYVALRTTLPDESGEPKEIRRSYSICAEPRRRKGLAWEGGGQAAGTATEKTIGDVMREPVAPLRGAWSPRGSAAWALKRRWGGVRGRARGRAALAGGRTGRDRRHR